MRSSPVSLRPSRMRSIWTRSTCSASAAGCVPAQLSRAQRRGYRIPHHAAAGAPDRQDATVELNGAQVPTFNTYIRNTDPGSVAGIPGLQIPAGLTVDGLPVGIELDGPSHSDRRLLAIGLAVQNVMPKIPAP